MGFVKIETSTSVMQKIMRLFNALYLNVYSDMLTHCNALSAHDVAKFAVEKANKYGQTAVANPLSWSAQLTHRARQFQMVWVDERDGRICKFLHHNVEIGSDNNAAACIEYHSDSVLALEISECLKPHPQQ